jgi:hypothetical protein
MAILRLTELSPWTRWPFANAKLTISIELFEVFALQSMSEYSYRAFDWLLSRQVCLAAFYPLIIGVQTHHR